MSQPRTAGTRFAVQYRPDPLLLVAFASVAIALIALSDVPLVIRLPAGLLGVFVLPGYALGVALLPAPSLDLVERWLLSGSLSVAAVIVAAPFLDAAGLGVRPVPMVMVLTGATLAAAVVGYWRRSTRTPAGSDADLVSTYATPTSLDPPTWRNLRQSLTWVLAAALLAGSMTILLSNRPAPSTEFFVFGSDGFADSYPTEVAAGEQVSVRLGITNREGETVTYQVAAHSASTQIAALESISVDSGDSWTGRLDFTLFSRGHDQEVRIELHTAGDEEPHRSLRLWIDVLEPLQQ
jgi:uncharacterized membrane protein